MRRLLVLPVALAAAAVSLAACGSDTDSSAAVSSAPVSASASAAASSTSSSPEAEADETAPAPTVTDEIVDGPPPAAAQPDAAQPEEARSPLGSDACAFATQESLLAALRSTPAYERVARPTGFRRIQCSTPFALASTSGTPQSSGVLFQRTGESWTVLDVGSAIQCAQYGVTAAQALALEGCVV